MTEIAEHTGACDLRQSGSLGRAASEASSGSRSGSGSGGLKYGSGDTLSDFVTFVCEETRKNQRLVSLVVMYIIIVIKQWICGCLPFLGSPFLFIDKQFY